MTERNHKDQGRASAEGMGGSIGQKAAKEPAPEELSLDLPEFLEQVIEEFHNQASGLVTLREAALLLARQQALSEFEKAIINDTECKLQKFLQQHLGEQAWQELELEESRRRLKADQIFNSTPG
ncbi:MAG TPA: hypothetical protein VGA89_02065 [Patescibacteria group bacterium]